MLAIDIRTDPQAGSSQLLYGRHPLSPRLLWNFCLP